MRLMWRILARMKRFSAREFALLCVPVVAVAGVGFWASRRPVPQPYIPPKFSLSYEPPSALKAFEGAQTVIVAKLGDDSDGNSYILDGALRPKYWLDATTPQGTKTLRDDGSGSLKLKGVSMSVANNQWFYFYLTAIPDGDLTFGISGKAISSSFPSKAKPHQIKQELRVDKTRLKNFDFSLPRAPLVKIKSATISQITRPSGATVQLILVVQGGKKMEEVRVQTDFKESHGYVNSSSMQKSPNAPRNFVIEADVFDANGIIEKVELSGRISADNQWPLAFEIEPFDYAKVKVGQQLKFKSWPAPLPPGANR